jgi:cytochrome P450
MTLATETPSTMSEAVHVPHSSAAPAGPEDESLDALAARILAREQGVVAASSASTGKLRRFLFRALALPLGVFAGAILGMIAAPVMLVLQGAWWKRIALFAAAPFAGVALGAILGWRKTSRGKLAALPLVARLLHHFQPVIALPRTVTHQLFGVVLVTRYADVCTVLERNDVFRVSGYDDRMRAASGAFILGMDPGPTYEKEQNIAATAVGRNVAPLRELAVGISRALVEQAYTRSRTIDVVSEFTHTVQLAVVDRFFGIPNTRDERLIPWLETMSYFLFNLWVGGPYRTAAIEAGHEFSAHLRRVVRRRIEELAHDAPPRDDVLGRMLEVVRASGDLKLPTTEELVVRTMAGLVSGATVATIGLFVTAIDFLLDQPDDERAALKKAAQLDDDVTVKKFLVEAARFYAYPPTLYRHAIVPYVFHAGSKHEATVERGGWVLTMPILANYDARVFPNPGAFNPLREHTAGQVPLLFGWAQHKCLGAHMAELLMLEMTKALFARGIARVPGPDGRLKNGTAGVIPDGDYARRLVVSFD